MYQSIYDLISTYVFNGDLAVGSNAELVCMLVSTFAVVFLVSIPFILVWRLILAITR